MGRLSLMLVLILQSVSPAVHANPTLEDGLARQPVFERLDKTLGDALQEWSLVPGHAVALVGPQGVVWSKGYGHADLEAGRPMTADTPLLLASVSKTLIAAAIMSEHEAGRLQPDQPINELLPFAVRNPHAPQEAIRLWHLAAHSSGVLDHPVFYEQGNYAFGGDASMTLEAWLRSYLFEGEERYDAELNFADRLPGEQREYSNVGASLAAFVTAQTAGVPYHELLQDRFFQPLNMGKTHFFIRDFGPNELAVPYFWDEEKEKLTRGEHYGGATYPDGWLRSSVNDMGNFVAMMINRGELLGQRVLTPASVAAIETELAPEGEADGETQAWFWSRKFNGKALVHSGYDYGTSTYIFYFPERGMGGVVVSNSNGRGTGAMRMISLQALTDAMAELAELP
ncbi:MAG: serine hydrolase [Pseudomonadota bacterium]